MNPKVGLFLLAYLPQFVPAGAPFAVCFLTLAAVYLAIGAVWLTIWVLVAGSLSRLLSQPRTLRLFETATGAVLLALGARMAFSN